VIIAAQANVRFVIPSLCVSIRAFAMNAALEHINDRSPIAAATFHLP